jgi:hypothetical protein
LSIRKIIEGRKDRKESMVHPLNCQMRPLNLLIVFFCCMSRHLAAGARAAGDTRALAGLLAARDLVARPFPAGASTRSAKDVSVGTSAGDTDSVVSHGKARDRNPVSGFARWRSVLIVLLDNYTVFGDVGEDIAGVSNTGDLASSTVDSLDTETVLRVGDLVVQELDVGNGVVVTTTDRTDGETVTTSAGGARNGDISTRVDSDTVVLDCMSV